MIASDPAPWLVFALVAMILLSLALSAQANGPHFSAIPNDGGDGSVTGKDPGEDARGVSLKDLLGR